MGEMALQHLDYIFSFVYGNMPSIPTSLHLVEHPPSRIATTPEDL
jgi:hypothetical protein